MGDGVAHTGVAHLFDGGGQKPDLAWPEFCNIFHLGAEHAEAVNLIQPARFHHTDAVALFDLAVHHADQNDHAEIRVIIAVDQHGLERCIRVTCGCRQAGDDCL